MPSQTYSLSPQLIWSLRAMAQDYFTQQNLYPPVGMLGDALICDLDDACQLHFGDHQIPDDISAIFRLSIPFNGGPEYFANDAVRDEEFWKEVRKASIIALQNRDLPTSPPKTAKLVEEDNGTGVAVWTIPNHLFPGEP